MESYHFEPVGAITPIAIGEKHDETTKECHSTVLGDLSFMNPKLCDGLEGTALAVSDLVTYQNNLQLFDKKPINAVWKSSENHQIDLPIIFWSWLRIYTNQPEKLFNEIKEKFPFIDAFHDNNSQVIINGSDDYIVCTDIMECTYQLGERTYFELGFFRAPSLLCLRDNNYDNMKLKELKEARASFRKEFVYKLLQAKADRLSTKVDWCSAGNQLYFYALSEVNNAIIRKKHPQGKESNKKLKKGEVQKSLNLDWTIKEPKVVLKKWMNEKNLAIHWQKMTNVSFVTPRSYRLLEGTALAISDYSNLKYGLQVYKEARKNAKWKCSEIYDISLPTIFWSELQIFTADSKKIYKDIINKFPFVKVSLDDDRFQVIIHPSEEYIICTDITCTTSTNLASDLKLGFFRDPDHLTVQEGTEEKTTLRELKKARFEFRKEYVFKLLQGRADETKKRDYWLYAADYCYSQFLTKFNDRVYYERKRKQEKVRNQNGKIM